MGLLASYVAVCEAELTARPQLQQAMFRVRGVARGVASDENEKVRIFS